MINGSYSIDIYRINNPQAGKGNDIFADCTRDPLCSNPVCDPSLSVRERAAGLVKVLNVEEKLDTLVDKTPGVPRLGIWPYEWWSEALHGLAYAPGNEFEDSGNFSSATSFPMPIVMAASFNDDLVFAIGEAISIEARAYANAGLNGFDFYVRVPKRPKFLSRTLMGIVDTDSEHKSLSRSSLGPWV